MGKKTGWLLLLMAVFFCGCEKWNLDKEVFLQVVLAPPVTISLDSVSLAAELKDFTDGQILTHGFLWSTSGQAPTINARDGIADLRLKSSEEVDPTFSAAIQLEANQEYLLRAFASLDESEYVYSEAIQYVTGNAMVFSEGINYEGGTSLRASGRLSGMTKGFVALEHGFCWSTDNPLPTREDRVVNLGARRNDEPFVADIDDLVNNAQHYIRAYTVVIKDSEVEALYGEVMEFDGDLEFWSLKASVPPSDKLGWDSAVGFSIGNKGYVGTGSLFNSTVTSTPTTQFWEYDPQDNTWTQKADFGGEPRKEAVGFSIDDKGYIGMGTSFVCPAFKDFWEYDPQSNTWIQKADFGGEARSNAVGLSIGDKGYVGTGNCSSQFYNDFWEYTPQSDTWTRKANFGGGIRANAICFSIGTKGYVGIGRHDFFDQDKDFWEYDPQSDIWTQKADFGDGNRSYASGFSLDAKGYVLFGFGNADGCVPDLWAYDPGTDLWTRRRDFQGDTRSNAIAFSIGNKGYCGTSSCSTVALNDFWEYDPVGL